MGIQIISPCSQWLARCHVTIQRCSAAPAPKLSGREKLLPCHRLTPRRSFFPDWQTVGMPMCSSGPRFRPRLAQRGIRFQCWHIFPLREAANSAAAPASRADPVTYDSARGHMTVISRIKTCRSAMGRVLDHQASFRLCGTTRLALLSRGFRLRQSIERLSR